MNTDEYWNNFYKSGSVEDYLSYKNSLSSAERENENEDEHQRNNTPRTEYR